VSARHSLTGVLSCPHPAIFAHENVPFGLSLIAAGLRRPDKPQDRGTG
jgi:hypothetical protein